MEMPNNTSDMIVGEVYGSKGNEEDPSRALSVTARDMAAERAEGQMCASAKRRLQERQMVPKSGAIYGGEVPALQTQTILRLQVSKDL
jgi:hypothetical protein